MLEAVLGYNDDPDCCWKPRFLVSGYVESERFGKWQPAAAGGDSKGY